MKLLFLILIIPTLVFSQTYYIDFTGGNDANSGLTPALAWKNVEVCLNRNIAGNKWSSILAGDSVLLKRGETWNPASVNVALIYPPSGKQGNVGDSIYIGAYGSGVLPIISTLASGASSAIYLFGTKYFILDSLEIHGRIEHGTAAAYPNVGYERLSNLTVNCQGVNAASGAILHANGALNDELNNEVWTNYWAEHITIRNCNIINTPATAIKFWMGRYIKISHNYIYLTSGSAGIDFGEGNCDTLEYNHITSTVGHAIKMQAQRYTQDSLVIRGNICIAPTLYMHALLVYQTRYSKIYNNTLIGNTGNVGTGYYYAFGTGWVGSQPIYFSGQGTWGVDSCLIANNIIYGGILLNETVNTGLVYHYRSDTVRFNWTVDSLEKRNTWKNNIIYRGGSDTVRIRKRTWDTNVYEHYWNTNNGACPYATCTNTAHPAPYYQWTGNNGTPFATIIGLNNINTAWNGTYTTIGNNLSSDPLLTNVAGVNISDFTPLNNSPCELAGYIVAGWTKDILGRTVPTGIVPTIGAIYTGDATVYPPITPSMYKKKILLKP